MCNLYNDRSMLENSEKPLCRCEEYKEEISNLNLKIEALSEEVSMVKTQMEGANASKENIESLGQELNKVICFNFFFLIVFNIFI